MSTERGAASAVEVAVLLPVLFALMELLVVAGRVQQIRSDVILAAHQAARLASVAQHRSQVDTLVAGVANASLDDRGAECRSVTPLVAPGTDWRPGGRVEVSVACVVELGDLSWLGLAVGDVTLSSTRSEVIDPYRTLE